MARTAPSPRTAITTAPPSALCTHPCPLILSAVGSFLSAVGSLRPTRRVEDAASQRRSLRVLLWLPEECREAAPRSGDDAPCQDSRALARPSVSTRNRLGARADGVEDPCRYFKDYSFALNNKGDETPGAQVRDLALSPKSSICAGRGSLRGRQATASRPHGGAHR